MPVFSPELFLYTLALIGAVIIISALFSGVIERTGVPQVLLFLGIGALIGPAGLELMDAGVDSPILRVVSTLSLALVLFTDAVSLNVREVREHKSLAFLVLGPGTILTAVMIAVVAWGLLGLHPALAAILGAALASTDPILLRGFLKRPGLDSSVRQALRLESGMNDAVLLPVVLVSIALYTSGGMPPQEWGRLAVEMLLLSPGIGVLIAMLAIGMLEFVRRRTGVRRDYESIYSLGVAFAAFAGAEAVHGSGFLAVFAAGLTIAALDVELCDCFLEYGETTAEMALLFTFVLFGASVVWTGFEVLSPATLVFTGIVFLARAVAFIPALLPARIPWRNRVLIAWFGPRGLSSLLLVLLAVFAGVRGGTELVAICSLVVLFSILVHGFSPLFVRHPQQEGTERAALPTSEKPAPVMAEGGEYISIDEYRAGVASGAAVTVVDARTERTFGESDEAPASSVRVTPDRAVAAANSLGLPRENVLAVLCA
jgi:NhaP-type Na+/H+ or K+/H+ antiporter